MKLMLLCFFLCSGYAVVPVIGDELRVSRRDNIADKHSLPRIGRALSSHAHADANTGVHAIVSNETRHKRTPQPSPKAQILLRTSPFLTNDELITKRQFLPLAPELAGSREFAPRREFEQTLLPTPRIIRPLELDSRRLPIDRGLLERGEPLNLDHGPLLGQGMLSPQLIPHLRRQFGPLEHFHRPLLQDVGPLPSELEQHRHMLFDPRLEPHHALELPFEQRPLHFHPMLEPRVDSTADSLHYGSLGDTPLMELPQQHSLGESFVAPHYIGNPEPIHRFEPSPLPEGLPLAEPQHRFRETVHPSPMLRHHVGENLEAEQVPDPTPSPDDGSDGDDSIETMMNELGRHKKRKAWVTDVNIYDKKNKDEDISKFLDSGDDDVDDYNPCAAHPCQNGGRCHAKDNGHYECICKRYFKGKHCSVRSRCAMNPCRNRGKCTETVSGFECTCAVGYKGSRCMERNRCLPNPCLNEGTCNESPEGFVCSCGESYQGKICEVRRTVCNPNPCLNNAQCVLDGSSQYKCICLRGFSGRTCDMAVAGALMQSSSQRSDIAVPTNSPVACINNPCMNNAVCQPDATTLRGYKCVCESAEYKGILCEGLLTEGAFIPTVGKMGAFILTFRKMGAFIITDEKIGMFILTLIKKRYAVVRTMDYASQTEARINVSVNRDMLALIVKSTRNAMMIPAYMEAFVQRDWVSSNANAKMDTRETDVIVRQSINHSSIHYEISMDRCNPNPCLHGGTCMNDGNNYKCACSNTYKGKQCEDFNFCFPNPCKNGGNCFGYSGGFQCDCASGFAGKNCENKQYCVSNPCKNGGQCVEVSNSFKCLCNSGYSGSSCEVRNFCANNPCKNGATCQNKPNTYHCTCTEQFIGEQCETFNRCFESPCKNGGKCAMLHDDIECTCTIGFAGPRCEQIDECQPNPCQNQAACLNNPGGGFSCTCKEGFRGVTCVDVDPCHPNPCTHGVCSEINGGYVCNCSLGFRGPVCAEIDRCSPNPCLHGATCQEINGGVGYVCQCPVGYKGQICDMKDPCNPSPCQHDSKCLETATGSGYSCSCSSGWMGQKCEAVDTCVPDPCQHGGHCLHDGKAGYKCNCTQGFKGKTCEKIDLCSPNPCRFGSHCIQTDEESYQCVKNLCTPNPCKHKGKCIVVNDEGFECACTGGWRGRNCEDYDPCFSTPCLNGGTCTENSNGGFTCLCKKDFEGKYCGVHWCSSQPCTNGGTCIESGGAFSCRCKLGFSGPICEGQKNLRIRKISAESVKFNSNTYKFRPEESVCLPNPCENGGTCVPYYGIALCKCVHNYTGAHCSDKRHVNVEVGSTKDAIIKDVAALSKPTEKAANSQYNVVPLMPTNGGSSTSNPITAVVMAKKDDPCISTSCLHHGMCVVRTDGQPECICLPDFSGPVCGEIGAYGYSSAPKFFPKDECSHCDENAICVNSHCICKENYVGDGLECWAKTNRDSEWSCEQNPCQNGGTCKKGRSRCVCRLGYTGDYCQNYCPPVVHLSFDKMQGSLAKDESGNGNDAMLINGAEIVYEGGKCDSAVSLLGGDILFDGERFWPKPIEAVTIALWVKLDTNKGIQSIFDTIGGKFSTHKEGQYHVEIENGKVRWFHRNEKHAVVFSITSTALVAEGAWTHIAGTYDAEKAIAKLFINGDLVAKGPGNGFLSQDWTGKAGIGKHEHPYGNRLLRGMVDEFFIFNCALPRIEVLVLIHHCKLYFGKRKDYSQLRKDDKKIQGSLVGGLQSSAPPQLPAASATSDVQSIEKMVSSLAPGESPNQPPAGIKLTAPADHWVYHVAEKMHLTGDTRAGINRPAAHRPNIQQLYNNFISKQQKNSMAQAAKQPTPNKWKPGTTRPKPHVDVKKRPFSWHPGQFIMQKGVAKSMPSRSQPPPLLRAAWNMVAAKQRQDAARKKQLSQQANQEYLIERMYQSLFSKAKQPVNANNQLKVNDDIISKAAASAPAIPQGYVGQFSMHNSPGAHNQNSQGTMIRDSLTSRQSVYSLPQGRTQQVPKQAFYPPYASGFAQKKNEINNFMKQNPLWLAGDAKSGVPKAAKVEGKNSPSYNFAQYTSIPSALKPKALSLIPDPSEIFYGKQQRGQNGAKTMPVRANSAPSRNWYQQQQQQQQRRQQQQQQRRQQQQQQRAAQRNAKRPLSNRPVQLEQQRKLNGMVTSPQAKQDFWPKPNFVEEYATNRGIVRVQSITRPLHSNLAAAKPKGSMPVQRNSRPQKTSFSVLKDPWSVYTRLSAAKRQGYQQADSHASTATSSNTMEGATAPGQKGAGHNYGYGYGYGTGDQLKGGGWGQGFGGGGPGENQAGTHHTPDFNNPKMQWSHGQGWGQGGKGVQQETQNKPNPPAGFPSFFPPAARQKIAKQQQKYLAPRGPSIMNFGSQAAVRSSSNKQQMKQIDNLFSLRDSTPVSSPAYQVKYFATPAKSGGYVDDSDSAKSLRNQIISNAIADALKSIQKKKRTAKENL
eukprot:gene12220-13478_t